MPYHLLEHFLLSRIHAKHSIEVKSLGGFLGCITVCYIHFSFDGLLQQGGIEGGEDSQLADIYSQTTESRDKNKMLYLYLWVTV